MNTAAARERKPPAPAPGNETAARDGLTPRAFGIGLVLCGLMCLGLTYNRMITQGSFLGGGYYMDRGALFVLFLLVVAANPLLGVIKKRFVLTRGELLAIYTMFLILLPAWVMTKPVILYTTGTIYHATPELRHIEAVPPHLLPWLVPQGEGTVKDLYEGLPKGGSIPWLGWVLPLWSWGSFLVVLFIVLICLGVLMRRQWEEHERFAFPLMQVPLAMVEARKRTDSHRCSEAGCWLPDLGFRLWSACCGGCGTTFPISRSSTWEHTFGSSGARWFCPSKSISSCSGIPISSTWT